MWQEALAGIGSDEAWRVRAEALAAADRQRRLERRELRDEFARRRLAGKKLGHAARLAALAERGRAEAPPPAAEPASRAPAATESA